MSDGVCVSVAPGGGVTYELVYENTCGAGGPQVIASDDFESGDSLAGWMQTRGGPDYTESGGQGSCPGGYMCHDDCASELAYHTSSATSDGYVEFDYFDDNFRPLSGLVFRFDPATGAHYLLDINPGGVGNGSVSLRYNSGNDESYEDDIAAASGLPFGDGASGWSGNTDHFRVVMTGNSFEVWINGSLEWSVTDPNNYLPGPGYSGFTADCGDQVIDNYLAVGIPDCLRTSVSVADDVPAEISFVGCNGCAYAAGTVSWSLGTLDAGEIATLVWWGTTDAGLPDNHVIHNTGTVSSDQEGVLNSNAAAVTIFGEPPTPTPTFTNTLTSSPVSWLNSTITPLLEGKPTVGLS